MASVRIIHPVTDGKGGRRPRSNRRRAEKALPVSARKDDDPQPPKPRYHPKPKRAPVPPTAPQHVMEPPSVALPARLPVPPVPAITTGPPAAWDPEMAEAILLALAAYNELRKSDPDLTTVGTI